MSERSEGIMLQTSGGNGSPRGRVPGRQQAENPGGCAGRSSWRDAQQPQLSNPLQDGSEASVGVTICRSLNPATSMLEIRAE